MTFGELKDNLLRRLGDDPSLSAAQQHYTAGQAANVLNAVQRVFVFFSLCLETTATFTVPGASQPYFRLMETFPDWILVLRIRSAGVKLKPSRLADLAALEQSWPRSPGSMTRYAVSGMDLLSVYKQPATDTSADITYARSPVVMAVDSDTPEIPERHHPVLVDGSIALARAKEGAQEFNKCLPLWNRFMDAVGEEAVIVRARCRELGYDGEPAELARFDQSKILLQKVS